MERKECKLKRGGGEIEKVCKRLKREREGSWERRGEEKR